MLKLPQGITFFERGWLSSNNVLLQDDNNSVLIDTGYHTHAPQTLALVKSALKEQALSTVINTHLHSDHCGGNALLQASFAGLEIRIPPGHADLVDQWETHGLTYEPTGQSCPRFSKSGVLSNGECFEAGGFTWQVMSAAGHDPHSIILFNEKERILISADALWENGFGVVFPEIEGISAFDEVEETLDTLENLQPNIVLPGHGSAFQDFPGALARARSRLAQFRSAPEKHATYAAKVLLKFKLLEYQSIKISHYLVWSDQVLYLKLLHKEYASEMDYTDWVMGLCKDLERSGACKLDRDVIHNN